MKRVASVVSLAVSLSIATPPAAACGFDGLSDGNWAPMHPRSLEVAMAVRAAADRGELDASLLDARAAGPMGYLRASRRMQELGIALPGGAAAAGSPGLSVLLVESGLWSRFEYSPGGWRVEMHGDGAHEGDAVIVTSEAAVTVLLAGKLAARGALDSGLIAIDGPSVAARGAERLLLAL